MENGKWILLWRIAISQAGLTRGHFFALGLPPPDLPDYKTYSQVVPQSQGGAGAQGYQSITILWNQMDFLQLKTLSDIVDGVTNGTLYATVDRAHGLKLLNDFIDISGQVAPLEFQPVSSGRGVVFQNVTLRINNITILADPSAVF